jgi:3-methyladenine DNA glycosylase Mpg
MQSEWENMFSADGDADIMALSSELVSTSLLVLGCMFCFVAHPGLCTRAVLIRAIHPHDTCTVLSPNTLYTRMR